jgi:uncharacterized protein (TIGR03067 family)
MKGRMIGLMAVTLLVAAGASQADDKDDRDRLQGSWKVVSYEEDGKANDKAAKDATFVFKGDTFSFPWLDVKITGKFKTDSGKKPKAIDLSVEDAKGKGLHGIYALAGDTLKLCFGEERPKEFKTKADSKQWMVVLKREKQKDK